MKHAIGERIRKLRQQRKLSLRDLEEKTGVSYSYIQRMENGTNDPTVGLLAKIADGLEVPITAFFGEHMRCVNIESILLECDSWETSTGPFYPTQDDVEFMLKQIKMVIHYCRSKEK